MKITMMSAVFAVSFFLSSISFAGITDIGSASVSTLKASEATAARGETNLAYQAVSNAFNATTDARPIRLLRCVVDQPVDTASWLTEINRQLPCASITNQDVDAIIANSYETQVNSIGPFKYRTQSRSSNCMKVHELADLVAKRCGMKSPWRG